MDKTMFSSPMNLRELRITDQFWQREQELVRREVIPYQWEALNDRVPGAAPSYCMHNFRAAGRLVREKRTAGTAFQAPSYTFRGFEALPEDPAHPDPDAFYGFVFQDTDFSKWIEAAAYTLAQHDDPELERIADEAIDQVCAAQWDNGYLDTYYIINGMDRAFTNLKDHHELYCLGHLVEGAVAYYQATGKKKLLQAACGYADYAASYFGPDPGQCKGYPGHEIAEMALFRLYEVTGCERYLRLAMFFLDQRGTEPHYFAEEEKERYLYEHGLAQGAKPETEVRLPARIRALKPSDYMYYQAHQPVREQSEAVGHAVRAGYLYSGMADAARLTGDEAMFAACERLWRNITDEKLYITGGIGGTNHGEAFSYPYDLPNDLAYSETCAAISLAFFARRMLQIRPASEYADVMELALFNTVLAGMALDGKSFFYVNPLEVDPEACRRDPRKFHVQPVRQKWFGCACCPPNLARIVSSIGAYAYTENEDTLWTHLYMGSTLTKKVGDARLSLQMETGLPWNGSARLYVNAAEQILCTLAFRIPGWSGIGRAEILCGAEKETVVWTEADAASGESGRRPCTGGESAGENCGVAGEDDGAAGENGGVVGENGAAAGAPGQKPVWWIRGGYLYVRGSWQKGDYVHLAFSMEVHMKTAHTRVREDIGKVAFMRGPVTFCAEEADNGKNLHLCRVDLDRIREKTEMSREGVGVEMTDMLGHTMAVLKVPAKRQQVSDGGPLYTDFAPPAEEDITLTLIPYYAWANRGEGEMTVWLRT